MKTHIIKSASDLEKFKDAYGYKIDGHAEFEYSAEFSGRLLVDGSLTIEAGWSIEAGGSIKAGGPIKAGGFIKAGWSIEAGGYIEAGWSIEAGGPIKAGGSIKAGGYIEAGEYIEAGWSIEAGGYIEAGEPYGILSGLSITCKKELTFGLKAFAGCCTWREITDAEKTITCGKFNGGVVEYGILKETGIDNKKKITIDGKEIEISEESFEEFKKQFNN